MLCALDMFIVACYFQQDKRILLMASLTSSLKSSNMILCSYLFTDLFYFIFLFIFFEFALLQC
jgi:hypothetical protein